MFISRPLRVVSAGQPASRVRVHVGMWARACLFTWYWIWCSFSIIGVDGKIWVIDSCLLHIINVPVGRILGAHERAHGTHGAPSARCAAAAGSRARPPSTARHAQPHHPDGDGGVRIRGGLVSGEAGTPPPACRRTPSRTSRWPRLRRGRLSLPRIVARRARVRHHGGRGRRGRRRAATCGAGMIISNNSINY